MKLEEIELKDLMLISNIITNTKDELEKSKNDPLIKVAAEYICERLEQINFDVCKQSIILMEDQFTKLREVINENN